MSQPWPTDLTLLRSTGQLQVTYDNGDLHRLDAELLRVMTPSAADRGHGSGPGKTVSAKAGVTIVNLTPIGRYAVRLEFSDGHSSGLYTWVQLHALGQDRDRVWADYLARLETEGLSRNP
jgi:DUF971 family protein